MSITSWLRSFLIQTPPGELPEEVCGSWLLVSAGGQPPPILEHKVTFEPDGSWTFKSKVAASPKAPDEYLEASGGGEWYVEDGVLSFTAGDNAGRCSVEVQEGKLVLGKDPVLQLNHVTDKTSVYERFAG